QLSAVDLYWAAMAVMVAPLPADQCPTPDWLRAAYETYPESIKAKLDPELLEHRDYVYGTWLTLPVDT
ncbi:MAG TPA: hypothetical protein VLA56_22295, partial [Pseudomonadales bacterium]|nr:hypothetical protein [Pseudomonadales bacterium]HSG91962.1 hypothetical protein [Pseudomonadales bacterium]